MTIRHVNVRRQVPADCVAADWRGDRSEQPADPVWTLPIDSRVSAAEESLIVRGLLAFNEARLGLVKINR